MRVFRQGNDFGLYIRSVCTNYIGCTGCPLAGGVVTNISDSAVVCESGRGKANSEQRARDDSDSANQAGDGESQE